MATEAAAEAIRIVNEQLVRSPRYIELARAKRWNGVLPPRCSTPEPHRCCR